MDVDKAIATQLANIEKRSGKSLAEFATIIAKSGLTKHGELVAMLKADLGLGHGDANTVVHKVKQAAAPAIPADADPLDAIYNGASAPLRAIHERIVVQIQTFGAFEIAPKKSYVSLRRKKQFAMLGPGSKTTLEIGLNAKREDLGGGFAKQPAGGMCQFKRRVASVAEIDAALIAAIRLAFDEAG